MAKLLGNPGILGQGWGGACVWPSLDNPGMAKLLVNPRILGQGGHMCSQPWTIPGWLSYLGIPGYLDKVGACVWPSLDNPGMAKLLGNPGILGQVWAGACVWPSLHNPGMAKLLVNPRILGQGGHVCSQPWTIPGWLSYFGIPGYLDKGGGACVWPSLDNPGMAKLLGNLGNS